MTPIDVPFELIHADPESPADRKLCNHCLEPINQGYKCADCIMYLSRFHSDTPTKALLKDFHSSTHSSRVQNLARIGVDQQAESRMKLIRENVGRSWRKHLEQTTSPAGVLVTKNGHCYHRQGCTYARHAMRYTRSSAVTFLRPCSYCH
ncbi:hypothetical protein K227x_27360 [Rubripirellula lacrimiformis]|uniref:Uncharacterized protein n=1 Tax=Rubripirellula lacrimiformis TaxID=1930273 RepID=A0A517NB34_9BACT|nr:hypothetical protein K227x_27360 [Rubripirellula lacrimiformis]